VKLLLDENLSWRMVKKLGVVFPEVVRDYISTDVLKNTKKNVAQ